MKRIPIEQEYAALLRGDFHGFIERSFYELNPGTEFQDNWHLHVIADTLEQVRLGEQKRVLILVPPRSLKSHSASVAFPAFVLGHDPSAQIICVSYAQDLSNKLASDCRSLMMSKMYKRIFDTRIRSRRPAIQELVTTKNGFRFATSVGGVLTGRGGDYLIIDDPLQPYSALSEIERRRVNDWYDHTLLSRLNDKRSGRIIIVMQRLHEDDLVGHVLDKDDWCVLRFPVLADRDEAFTIRDRFGNETTYRRHVGEVLHPEHEDRSMLDKMAFLMGSYDFDSQYQQAPSPAGGGMIKADWFKTYVPKVPRQSPDFHNHWDFIFQSWDTANKATELSDFSVCTTWGVKGKHLFLLDVYRNRLDYPTLKRAVIELAGLWWPRTIVIEDMASGTQLVQDLIADGVSRVQRYRPPPGQDKVMRMHTCCSTIENGFVHLPENAEWLEAYKKELRAFPKGKHDDQVDSTSQALDWMKHRFENMNTVSFSMVRI